jgi:hypothetical protein
MKKTSLGGAVPSAQAKLGYLDEAEFGIERLSSIEVVFHWGLQ